MRYELIESGAAWIVRCDGLEVARYGQQAKAMAYVTECLNNVDRTQAASLAVHFEPHRAA